MMVGKPTLMDAAHGLSLAFYSAVLVLMITSCSYQSRSYSSRSKNSYYSEFNKLNTSQQLDGILQSVKKVNCYTTYTTYDFGDSSHIKLTDLHSDQILYKAVARLTTQEATSGSSLIIYSDASRIALLTCAHVVNLPDTIISWLEYGSLDSNRFIQSISVKTNEKIIIREIPDGGFNTILAIDKNKDLAIIGKEFRSPVDPATLNAFQYPVGNSDELSWGSDIFLAGYPTGQLMVTRGMVSLVKDHENSFLTDAPFNEGFSGGIALAFRDRSMKMELVGIGRSVTATTKYTLKPEKDLHEYRYNPSLPYTGDLYVKQDQSINYGVTWIIPVNIISSFYRENRARIKAGGYNLDYFFKVSD